MAQEAMKKLACGVPVAIVASTARVQRNIQHMTRNIGLAMNLRADPEFVVADEAYARLRGFRGKVFVDHAVKMTDDIREAAQLAEIDEGKIMDQQTNSKPSVIRCDVNPVWKADVERLLDECKTSSDKPSAVANLKDYLRANNGNALVFGTGRSAAAEVVV
jgi:hypothetical protein